MSGIYKSFGAVHALVDVNLVLYPGEILGLVGDNSAGKSTLMKILTGAYQRDAGEIRVAGKDTHFRSPHESRDRGIEMIYQDSRVEPDVGQNILLAAGRSGVRSSTARLCTARPTRCRSLKVDVNSVYQRGEPVWWLPAVCRHRPRFSIPRRHLDELTANLSVMATERLLETMLELKKQGVAQVIISHRLQDIFAVGDRVMVLKRGENVGDRYIAATTEHEALGLIVSGTRAIV